MNWLAILLFAGASQALLLSVLILCIKTGSRLANLFLASFLGLMALTLLLNFLAYSDIHLYAPLYGLHMLQILSGPLLYLYVRVLTEPGFTLSPKLAWHALVLLPPLVLYFVTLSQIDLDVVQSGMSALKKGNLQVQVFGAGFSLMYGSMSLHKLSLHRSRIEQAFSVIEEVSLVWLRWLILLFIVVKSFHFTMVILSDMGLLAFELRTWISLLLSLAIVYLISIGGLRQPLIFTLSLRSVLERISDEHELLDDESAPTLPDTEPAAGDTSPGPAQKYKKSGLDADRMLSIWGRLQTVMLDQQPQLGSALNLAELADIVEVKPHDLSRVINAHAGVNFYEFINSYRVKAAMQLLSAPSDGRFTLLDAAMEVGFNSQSTFYSHFKKHTGMTPKQYRDRPQA